MKLKFALTAALSLAVLLPTTSEAQNGKFDQLNGQWIVTLDGQQLADNALTESYPELGGVRLRFLGESVTGAVVVLKKKQVGDEYELTFDDSPNNGIIDGLALDGNNAATTLQVALQTEGQVTKRPEDDRMTGTLFGKPVLLERDMRSKPPIEIRMPGDRPWVRFMQEILIPKTAEDRETYHRFDFGKAAQFLRSCQLYRSGYWQKKYMKGADRDEQSTSFGRMINALSGDMVSPRSMMHTDFRAALEENLSDDARQNRFGLAASSLGLYFSTAGGGAVRIIVTDNEDSVIYYITDTRRNSKIGLVVMDTPAHAPLASSFGRWLLDFGQMPARDDRHFGRALLETLAKSSSRAANRLTDTGKSAYSDYLGVMAIEDQRGVMFDNAGLKWGLNMTNASFTALICRALSHGETRPGPVVTGREWLGLDGREELDSKVIVSDWNGDPELRKGDPSYFDTLNGADNVLDGGLRGGDDLQERGGMRLLKQLTTSWLREEYPAKVKRVEDAFAAVVPLDDISEPDRAREDIFHLMADYFYEPSMASVTPTQATELVRAGMALLDTVRKNSEDLEAYLLSHGVVESDAWAPRASGF